MKQSAMFAVVGGDVRQAYLAELLRAEGHEIRIFALDRHPIADCTVMDDLREGLLGARAVILPLPVCRGDGLLNAPLANAPHLIGDVLDAIPAHTLTLAGSVPFSVHARAVRNDLNLIDYLARDDLATLNAVPTCEGALQLAMEQTDFTLHGADCLVIGCGRIGFMLAQRLAALGANVTVSARSAHDFARIRATGFHHLDTRSLAGRLAAFPLIFNTVPAPVLGAAELSNLHKDALIIDLASLPGGLVPGCAVPSGCRMIHALSLPGKVAPRSAACALRETICAILDEEGLL